MMMTGLGICLPGYPVEAVSETDMLCVVVYHLM